MVDLSPTIIAKSDQLNADDLIGTGPILIQITRVVGYNDKDQPIGIHYDGDGGKPYKPGKSMRRVLINFWGKDGDVYVGRWLRLFRDPDVTFGKIKVGGIRIGAMSDLGDDTDMALTVTKGAKRLFSVQRLQPPERQRQGGETRDPKVVRTGQVDAYIKALGEITTIEELREYQLDERRTEWRDKVKDQFPDLFERIVEAQSKRAGELAGAEDDSADTGGAEPSTDDDEEFPS